MRIRTHSNWILIGLLALAGCAAPPKTVDRQVVPVPVPVPCVDASTPRAPALLTAAELSALSDYSMVLKIGQERLALQAWAAEVSPVLDACRIIAAPR